MAALKRIQARLQALMAAYGPVALGIWFTIFGSVLFGFWGAIGAGVNLEAWLGPLEGAGTFGVAYFATQLTKPLRALATLALTPWVAARLGVEPAATPEPVGVPAE